MKNLEKRLNYQFKNEKNFINAITHSSYVKEENIDRKFCNERLEFLGDSVLGAVISEYLFENLREDREGSLAKLKSDIVRAETLADIATKIGVGDLLILGRGEIKQDGKKKLNLLADALEAIIGAVFIESGYEMAKSVILSLFKEKIDLAKDGKLDRNFKSKLQEYLQKRGITNISYVVDKEEGLSHDKTFYINLMIEGRKYGYGIGKSKKEAENLAAQEAYTKLTEKR